jgi:hypothetical protein
MAVAAAISRPSVASSALEGACNMSRTHTIHRLVIAAAALAGSFGVAPATSGATSPLILSELLHDSWKYVLETPTPEGPWTGGDPCIDLGPDRHGRHVVTPSAPLGVETLECRVPTGTPLFITVFSSECSNLETDPYDFGRNWFTGVLCALRVDRGITSVSLSVDDRNVPVHQVVTREIRFTNPDDDILQSTFVGPGGRAAAHGWVTLLEPLPTGTHVLVLRSAGTYLGRPVDFTNTTTIVVT